MAASSDPFVQWFRSSAPYIHAHRGRTFVILFGGELLQSRGARDFIHDVALLQSLGVRVVLVAGARPQIDAALARRGAEPRYVAGMRVTDDVALACVKEAAGTIHVELEALFSTSLPNSPMAGARVRVASGNFVTARPVGVIDGVDYEHSGLVRKIDAEAIGQRLDDGAVVLLSSIGYSLTGDAFNVGTPDVASATAVALKADKIICLTEGRPLTDGRGHALHEISPSDAEKLVASGRRLGGTCADTSRRRRRPCGAGYEGVTSWNARPMGRCCASSSRATASARSSRARPSRTCARRGAVTWAASTR